ncbi:hypothetical protein [Paenibacillus macerans]|uniref:hypothetical protein n=1 Tax=Paenibacillus macerans TaxID=44252 RepID=UPI00204123F1|nr:hypothetical protein [Paenibacillus macerans]MCM3699239.1 hypothetical protein [Paenibacillus macerans]
MINQDNVERLIGRKLTEKESQAIERLNDWDKEVSGTVSHLIKTAYLNGRLERHESED